jgi:fatty-acid desaturase
MIAMLKSLHFWRVWLVPHVLLVGGLALWGGDWRTLLAGVVFYTLISGFGAYRNYETNDKSVNRNWLGLITWGQALHNNHHACAADGNFAQGYKFYKRFEFDPSMLWINVISHKETK